MPREATINYRSATTATVTATVTVCPWGYDGAGWDAWTAAEVSRLFSLAGIRLADGDVVGCVELLEQAGGVAREGLTAEQSRVVDA